MARDQRSVTTLAQQKIKTGDGRPTFRVEIGGLELADAEVGTVLKSASAAYDIQAGTSEAEITSSMELEDLINEPAIIEIGYGRALVPYFQGDLWASIPNELEQTHVGKAYGPFKLMAGEPFGERVDYSGATGAWRIDEFFMDLHRRAGYRAGTLEVRSRRPFILKGDEVIFNEETYLGDAASSVAEAAGYITPTDMPGGRRLVMPRPLIGSTGRAKAEYAIGTYPSGAFKAESETRRVYNQVWILRRGESGALDFPIVKAKVHHEGKRPRGTRPWIISEFVGDEEDAAEEAERYASVLSQGLYACELAGIGQNPDLSPYDTLRTEAVEAKDEGYREKELYETEYDWVVDSQIGLAIDENGRLMSVAGMGIRTRMRKLQRSRFVTDRRRSPYVVRD